MRVEDKIPEISVKYEVRKLDLEVDSKTFEPCKPKCVDIWRWSKMKTEKLIVHIDKDLNLTVRRLEA